MGRHNKPEKRSRLLCTIIVTVSIAVAIGAVAFMGDKSVSPDGSGPSTPSTSVSSILAPTHAGPASKRNPPPPPQNPPPQQQPTQPDRSAPQPRVSANVGVTLHLGPCTVTLHGGVGVSCT